MPVRKAAERGLIDFAVHDLLTPALNSRRTG